MSEKCQKPILSKPEHVFETDGDSSQQTAMKHTGPEVSLMVYCHLLTFMEKALQNPFFCYFKIKATLNILVRIHIEPKGKKI